MSFFVDKSRILIAAFFFFLLSGERFPSPQKSHRAVLVQEVLFQIEEMVLLCNLGDSTLPRNIPGTPNYNPNQCDNIPQEPSVGIDPGFQENLIRLSIEPLPQDSTLPAGPLFKVTLFQIPANDTSQSTLTIQANPRGDILRFSTLRGPQPSDPPIWLDEDPRKLFEMALEFVIQSAENDPRYEPYRDSLKSMSISTLSQNSGRENGDEEISAMVILELEGGGPSLQIRMDLSGEIIETTFI